MASAGGDAKRRRNRLLMVEKIEELVARQTEAIANLKIDKITVWDSGNNGGDGGATSNFVSSLIQSLPPVHDVAKMAGVDLPDYLGTMKEEEALGLDFGSLNRPNEGARIKRGVSKTQ